MRDKGCPQMAQLSRKIFEKRCYILGLCLARFESYGFGVSIHRAAQ